MPSMKNKAEKLLNSKNTKEWFMIGGTHTIIPLKDYRFVKLRIDFKENGEDKFLFVVLEKNKFKKMLLENCREYRFYDVKTEEWVKESKLRNRILRKCPNGCKDVELEIIEKPNAILLDKKDPTSWIFKDIWKCTKCKKSWLVICHPEEGDSFKEIKSVKKIKGKKIYKTKEGDTITFKKSPSKVKINK